MLISMQNKYLNSYNDFIIENLNNSHELPEYWYHGTNKYFEKFSLDYLGTNWEQSILGVYFSQYLKPGIFGSTAKEYADYAVTIKGGTRYIYKCKIHTKNPLILNSNGWYSSNVYVDKNRHDINNRMKNNNHDCIIAYDFENKQEEGLIWGDYILVTNHLDIIEIADIIEYKD